MEFEAQKFFQTLFFTILPVCTAFAMMSDFRTMTIGNWLSIFVVGAFVPTALLAELHPIAWGIHFSIAAIVFILAVIGFALGWYGGGDAKFTAALSLWMGFEVVEFLVAMMLGGAVLSAVGLYLTRSKGGRTILENPKYAEIGIIRGFKAGRMPYGLAIGFGVFWVLGKLSTAPW